MATQKDFRIKNGLIVQNGNTTVDQGTVSIADQISGDTGQLIITNGQSGSSFMRIGIIGSGTANSHIRTDSTLEFHIGQSATSSTPSVSINTSGNIQVSGNVNASLVGANNIDGLVLQLNGTTVVNSSRNIVNVGTISNSAFTIPNSIGLAGQVLKVPSSGTTLEWGNSTSGSITGITNFADNRLLTASGSTTINGESNLTFDGSALNVVGDITLGDNKNIYIGTSNELQLVYNGNDSLIRHTISTGELKLGSSGTGITFYNPSNGDIYAEFNAGADVTLYHNDQPKIATTSTGIDITGTVTSDGLTVDGNILLNVEGNELQFNTSSTPVNKIYTDDTYTANGLTISANNGVALKSTNNYLLLDDTGTNEMVLNVDGGERMRVTSTGIDVTGTVVSDGLTVDGNINLGDNDSIYLGDSNDLRIYHDSGSSLIRNTTGSLYIQDDDGHVYIRPKSGQDGLIAIADGAVTLHHSGNAKIATTSTGIDVIGETLSMSHTGNTSTISLTQKAGTQNSVATITSNREDTSSSASRLLFSTNNGTSTLQRMRINNGGDISFYEDTGTTAKLFWDASAESLGIGLTNPSEKLEVSGKIKASGQIRAGSYLESFPSFSFANDTDTGMFSDTANQLEFSTGGSSRLTIDSLGTTTLKKHLVLDDPTRGIVHSRENLAGVPLEDGLTYFAFNHNTSTHPTSESEFDTMERTNITSFKDSGTWDNSSAFTLSSDGYLVEFHGYLLITTAGDYRFGLNADDATDMYIDGIRVADDYGGHGATGFFNDNSPTSIYLTVGYHKLFARFEEVGGGDSCQLGWNGGSGTTLVAIPSGNLYHNSADLTKAYDGTTYTEGNLSLSGTISSGAITSTGNSTFTGSSLTVQNNSISGNTQLYVHNNKTGDAAVLKLEGKRSSLNDTGQVLFANNSNSVAKIDARSAGDDGELRFFTSASGTGSNLTQALKLDSSQNATFAGKVTINEGNVADQLVIYRTSPSSNQVGMKFDVHGVHSRFFGVGTDGHPYWSTTADLTGAGNGVWHSGLSNFKVGTVSVLTSSRNLQNIGTISSGAITSSGNIAISAGNKIQLSGAGDGTHHIYHNSSTDYDIVNYSTGFQLEHTTSGTQFSLVGSTGNATFTGGITTSGVIQQTATEGREIRTYMPSSYTTNDIVSGHEYGWYSDYWRVGISRSGNTGGEAFRFNYSGSYVAQIGTTGIFDGTGYRVNGTTIVDSSRNLTNIGTISSGSITSSGAIFFTSTTSYIRNQEDASGQIEISALNSSSTARGVRWDAGNDSGGAFRPETTAISSLGLTNRIWDNLFVNTIKIGSSNTTVIDSSRNLTNIGTISSGDITTSGDLYLSEYVYHTGDTDTYIRIQDNSWTFRTGGGDRVVIDNSEMTTKDINVGGTGNGTVKVRHIEGKNASDANLGDLYLNYSSTGNVVIGHSGNLNDLYIYGSLRTGGTARIDNSGNLNNIGTISSSYFNSSSNIHSTGVAGFTVGGGRIGFDQSGTRSWTMGASSGYLSVFSGDGNGDLNLSNNIGLRQNGTLVLDSSRNLSNIGTISSGAITASGDSAVGGSTNISMSAASAGQLRVFGAGYTGSIALDGNAMHVYHNSSSRDLILGTNETARLSISGSGTFTFHSNNLQSIGTISSGAITTSGNVSVGGSAYTTNADLNLLGDGLAIKNDKNGSNNNWSYIQNTSSGSEANLVFTTGLGSALTLNHDRSATFSGKVIMGGDGAIAQIANAVAADTSNTYTLAVGSQSSSKSIIAARNINTSGGGYQINGTTVIDSSRDVTANSVLLSGLQTQVLSVSGGELLMGAVDNDDFVTNIKGFGGSTSMEFADGAINAVGSTTINHSKSSTANPVLALKNTSTTNEGRYLQFTDNAGSFVGQIGKVDQTESNIFISTFDTGLKFESYITYKAILPCGTDGADVDNIIDLGSSSVRFDDIYATNGTIQTSDKNEKQDIQALTEAEQRVATACKGLIRRFRWQDAVQDKDNNPDSDETARYHFGVMAQDLQSAFTAEGLDAGNYGMFISSTWTDDDGVEQTRLGVRYNELLSFIISTL